METKGNFDTAAILALHYKPRNEVTYLTIRGPWIVMYSYNKSQRDALFLKFILLKDSYCPSSGVSTLYTQQ